MGQKIRAARAALLALVLILVSACSSNSGAKNLERDEGAVAQLSYDNVAIRYPLSDYMLSDEEFAVIAPAYSLLLNSCTRERGFASEVVLHRNHEDRDFGLWNVERAQKYGASIPTDGEQVLMQAQGQQLDPKKIDAIIDECKTSPSIAQKRSRLLYFEPGVVGGESAGILPDRLHGTAYYAALDLPEAKEAISEYRNCLKNAGQTPLDDDWGSAEQEQINLAVNGDESKMTPDQRAEMVRLATGEAQCNNDVHLTQRLANMVASFEVPMIRENEAALAEAAKLKQDALALANEIIETWQSQNANS